MIVTTQQKLDALYKQIQERFLARQLAAQASKQRRGGVKKVASNIMGINVAILNSKPPFIYQVTWRALPLHGGKSFDADEVEWLSLARIII